MSSHASCHRFRPWSAVDLRYIRVALELQNGDKDNEEDMATRTTRRRQRQRGGHVLSSSLFCRPCAWQRKDEQQRLPRACQKCAALHKLSGAHRRFIVGGATYLNVQISRFIVLIREKFSQATVETSSSINKKNEGPERCMTRRFASRHTML